MPAFFLISLLFLQTSFAGFEGITVKNLDLDYQEPRGLGEVEKISLIFSLTQALMPVQIDRADNSFVIQSQGIDLTWQNPWKFLLDIPRLETKKASFYVGKHHHWAQGIELMLKPKDMGEFKFIEVKALCRGLSVTSDMQVRLMDDCRSEASLTAKRLEIPADFLLSDLLKKLPQMPSDMEAPAEDLNLSIKNGNFSLVFYYRYYVYAGFRAWGHVSYENNHSTITIRVDQIKWGYFNVTNLIMRELRDRLKHPKIRITPPYIRIDR